MKKHLTLLVCLFALTFAARADEEKVALKMENSSVGQVLAYYGHLIGKQIVMDNTVQGQLTVVSDGLLSPARAAALIETAIFADGFALVDSQDGTIVKVIGLGKMARAQAPPIYQSVDELPKNERVVSLVVKLKHAGAQQIQGFLNQYMIPSATTGCTVDPASGVLVIMAPTSMVRSAVKLLESVDVPGNPAAAHVPRPPLPVVPGQSADDDD